MELPNTDVSNLNELAHPDCIRERHKKKATKKGFTGLIAEKWKWRKTQMISAIVEGICA